MLRCVRRNPEFMRQVPSVDHRPIPAGTDSGDEELTNKFRLLKVLFVTNMYPCVDYPAWGVFVKHQADCLRELGHQVDVLHVLGRRSKFRYVTAAPVVLARTLKGGYDIVHAHYGLSGMPALFRIKTPLIVTLHGDDALGQRSVLAISRIVCLLADEVISVSEEVAAKIPGEVIPCGVDLEIFRPLGRIESRIKLGLPVASKLILFPFDRNKRKKRYDLAKRAVDELISQRYPCRLLHVYGVTHEEMPLYYNAADVMLLCSDREGSPVSLKEALACNTPVVSTDVGDAREIVRGVKGARICEQTVNHLADALKDVLWGDTDEDLNGHLAMERYNSRYTASRIVAVYRKVLQRSRREHILARRAELKQKTILKRKQCTATITNGAEIIS